MKRTLLCSAIVLALAGCASGGGSAPAASSDELAKLIAQAESEVALANKAGGLWTTTEKALKDAKDAQKAGETDKAMKSAKKAIAEAQAGQKQAADAAKNAKPIW